MPKLPTPDPIRYLVNRKYPESRSALARIVEHVDQLPDPANPLLGLVDDSDAQQRLGLSPEAEAYRKRLDSMPKDKVDSLYKQERQRQYEEEDKIQFFSQPDADADFDFWSRAAHWSLDEAVALTFGKEPRVVHWKRLEKLYNSPFAQKYRELRDLANRAKLFQKLFDPVLPGIYLGWVDQNELSFPLELREKIIARGNQIVDWKKQYDELLVKNNENVDTANTLIKDLKKKVEALTAKIKQLNEKHSNIDSDVKPLGTRERDTVCKIMIGMAIDGYGYDPKAGRSPTAKELEGILDQLDIPVSDDTIRKWLKEAAEHLPQEIE